MSKHVDVDQLERDMGDGGEVMHTLKVTAPGASAIARLLIRLANQYGSFEESILPLDTRYNEKKAS